MEYSYDNKGLREPLINRTFNPVPLFIQEVNASDIISFPTYAPDGPGVYSVILEVNDKANNSKYSRQVAIYDRTSNISTSSIHLIDVTTASKLTNFTWQTSQFSKIDVSWSGHFMNEVHEKGHFLEKILDYVPRLSDGKFGRRHDYKKILPSFDDNDGVRNRSFIPNIKSIIRFDTVGRQGIPMSTFPKTAWQDVTPLNDNKSFPLMDIRDGDSYQIWIRAHDIMGNSKVDYTAVHFDRSPPSVSKVKIEYNIDDGAYPFSRFTVVLIVVIIVLVFLGRTGRLQPAKQHDQNEEAIMKMKAKINFYTIKVGRHKNVLQFIGSVEDEVRGPMMILEYCSKGVLKQFLEAIKSNISVDIDERLYRIVFGICLGMDFLASKKVVHRRLAARNILLNGMYEPKITGFGPDYISDEGDDKSERERIPIKWLAPECMNSTKHANELSDVWSFGIVMWEIFSLGETPYPGLQSREVPGKIKQGYKMKKPERCDDAYV
ncbi:angiopoietin-1 receptor-like [Mytilus californianus]|uniref:angiopoietin-1 receptor-like n=1 Tax=Mytilus californianus TaxID=6549 RepID=UPI00224653A8|nr:angiopoietin-1 receptor-like [Mytilus californianus]